jgi:alkylated DNA repair dioxygenase AlkB
MNAVGFQTQKLPGCHDFLTGHLPRELCEAIAFERLLELHPAEFPEIQMHGQRVRIPRWQQAYGVNYRFSGQVSQALSVPGILEPVLSWCRSTIDPALNGLLLNWYDGQLGHYIGRHRDSTQNLVPNSAIVTVSFGEERVFRLRPWPHKPGAPTIDFRTGDGSVFILPWATNRAFTHEVTASKRFTGRRISVTIRAFATSG